MALKERAGVVFVDLHSAATVKAVGRDRLARSVGFMDPAIKWTVIIQNFVRRKPMGDFARRGLRRIRGMHKVTQPG